MASDAILIDGSHGEGGGQVLRNSISFAAILRKAIKINNIRAGRSKPGLQAQHMTCLSLCTDIRGGSLNGCWLGSPEISYTPPTEDNTEIKIEFVGDTKTAGSICLVLQAALPVALFSRTTPTDLILKGGTNATLAPQYDYWEEVFLPTLISKCGFPIDLIEHQVVRRGYFPRGGGEAVIEVTPWRKPLPPIILIERGEVSSIRIHCYYAGTVSRMIAIEMAESAKRVLKDSGILVEPDIDIFHEGDAIGSGCGILLVATTTTDCLLAGSALCARNKSSIDVGREAAEELVATLRDGGCVDEWLQDQLILFMALGCGTSEMLTGSLTMHTRTAIWIAEQLSGAKFEVKRLEEGTGESDVDGYGKSGRIPGKHLIRCIGINFVNTIK